MSRGRDFKPGDFITLSLDPTLGHEQGGWGRALVVSEANYNRRAGLALVCPITTKIKGYPFEVAIPEGGDVKGVVLSDHMRPVDLKARNAKYVADAPAEILHTVRGYVALLIGVK